MATSAQPQQRRVFMRELAVILDRSSHTIREWERDGRLPRSMRPHRDERGWRYWTPAQVVKLRDWVGANSVPGKGLSGFSPSPERVQEMLQNLRRPRDIPESACPHCGKGVRNLPGHVRHAHPETNAA